MSNNEHTPIRSDDGTYRCRVCGRTSTEEAEEALATYTWRSTALCNDCAIDQPDPEPTRTGGWDLYAGLRPYGQARFGESHCPVILPVVLTGKANTSPLGSVFDVEVRIAGTESWLPWRCLVSDSDGNLIEDEDRYRIWAWLKETTKAWLITEGEEE